MMEDFMPEVNDIVEEQKQKEKMAHMEEMLEATRKMMNKDLDQKVADGLMDEHEAREHYFHMMMLTMMIAR